MPEEVEAEGGTLTGDPMALFDAARLKLKGLWNAVEGNEVRTTTMPDMADNVSLPALTGQDLRAAAKLFSPATGSTYDGLHPRHFSLVSDAGLEAFAALLNLIEEIGAWPESIESVIAVLIPKPNCGVRPIGMFPGLYRVWARVRRSVATEWERAHDHPAFAAKEGNGALDTVWDQAFRSERAVGNGDAA